MRGRICAPNSGRARVNINGAIDARAPRAGVRFDDTIYDDSEIAPLG